MALPLASPSPARAGTTPSLSPPADAPVGLTATSSDGRVVLTWSAVSGSGYRIFRATSGVWDATPVATTSSLTYTNTGLTNGTTYTYKVTAYNRAGTGPASNDVSVTPLATPLVMVAAGNMQVTVSWQAVAGASTYTVYRSTSTSEASFAPIPPDLTGLSLLDTGLINGTTYYYRVRAAAPLGTSPPSAKVAARPLPPPPASAPGAFVVTSGNARADLTWDPVDNATGYRIFRTANGVFDGTTYTTISSTTYTNWSLTNGTTYSYKVAAYNLGGTGPQSVVAAAMPIAPPDKATATAGDQQVTLTWQVSAGATTYTLYRSTSTDDATLLP